jgi:hypothetical protein
METLLKGRAFSWYVVAVVLILACFFSTYVMARSLLPFAWIWPLVLWTEMGIRGRLYLVEPLLVSRFSKRLPLFDFTAAHDASLLMGIPWICLAASLALVGLTLLTRRMVLV